MGETDRVNFTNAFRVAFNRNPTEAEFKKISRLYIKNLPDEVQSSIDKKKYALIEGVKSLLSYLHKRSNVILGLATGNIEEGAYIKLKPAGILRYFRFGAFGDRDFKREDVLKKAVKRAEKIVKRKIEPSQVYVIGDTHKDVAAAKECGYHSACVLSGFGDFERIFASNPELIERDFSNPDVWLIWLGLKKDPKGVKRESYIFPQSVQSVFLKLEGIKFKKIW